MTSFLNCKISKKLSGMQLNQIKSIQIFMTVILISRIYWENTYKALLVVWDVTADWYEPENKAFLKCVWWKVSLQRKE